MAQVAATGSWECNSTSKFTYVSSSNTYTWSSTTGTATGGLSVSLPAGATVDSSSFSVDYSGATSYGGTTYVNGVKVGSGNSNYTFYPGAVTSASCAFSFKSARTPNYATYYATRTFACTFTVNYTPPPPPANPSLVTPNKWSMAPLDTVRSTLTVYNGGYWHRIHYGFHGAYTYFDLAAGTTIHDFTFPEAWIAYLTTAKTGYLEIAVETYNGGTLVGSKPVTITINIPSSYGPSIGSFTATLVKNDGPESIERYINNISKVTLAINTIGTQQGATVASRSIKGGGYSSSSTPATFGALQTAGDITFTATVTDSRGYSVTETVTITVQAYSSPTLSGITMFRCDQYGVADDEGHYVSLKATSVFSSIDGLNTATLEGRVYMRGGTPGDWDDMTSGTALLLGGGLLLISKTYITEIKITDLMGNYTITAVIPTVSGVGLHVLDGGTGAAVGKYAEKEKFFEIPDDWGTNIGHPVGSVYMSADATSPATLFGGTWAAIGAGTFLVAAGAGYEAGVTGGEATHVLTAAEMPTHYHQIWSLNWEVATGTSGAVATAYGDKGGASGNAGSGEAHNNMPPYLAVYMWRRTA